MTRTSITVALSVEAYDVFQDPDQDKGVAGAAVVFAAAAVVASVAGADGIAAAVVAAGVAVVVVAGVVPEEFVQPAASIIMQARPARSINNDFLIKISYMSP
jgi:hypothetical protein